MRKSSHTKAASHHPTGHGEDDLVVRTLKRFGRPVTRENYIDVAYAGEPPEPWTGEHEATLPRHLRRF